MRQMLYENDSDASFLNSGSRAYGTREATALDWQFRVVVRTAKGGSRCLV